MLELEWSMTLGHDALLINYRVLNRGALPLVVADCFLFNGVVEPSMFVVDNAPEPDTALFQRGNVKSRMKSYLPHDVPTVVRLQPSEAIERSGQVSWPLRAFHNIDGNIPPLRDGCTHAVLEVGWIDHPESTILKRFIAKDTAIETASHWVAQRWLRGERRPLPHVS
jgi:hypothetical protein